jgi:hypothetical protein
MNKETDNQEHIALMVQDNEVVEEEIRQAKRDLLTSVQQLEKLNKLLGKNTGAIKERIRLHSPELTPKKAGPKKGKSYELS